MPLAPLVVLLLLLFGGLLLIIRWVLTRYVAQATGHLQALSQDTMTQQESLRKQGAEADQQRRALLAKAEQETQALKAQAEQQAQASRQQLLEEARAEAKRIVDHALKTRAAVREELERAMDAKAVTRACELIQAVLPQALHEATHAQWLDGILADGLGLPTPLGLGETAREARVTSAYPLTASQRRQVLARLESAVGHPMTLQETVDDTLLAGVTITLGHLVVEGSLAAKLREAARHAHADANR